MDDKLFWKEKVKDAICALLKEQNKDAPLVNGGNEANDISIDDIIVELPPKPEMGDLGFPMFGFAKKLRTSPQRIAVLAAEKMDKAFDGECAGGGGDNSYIFTVGPYINIKLDRTKTAANTLGAVLAGDSACGENDFFKINTLAGKKIMVEFSSPNTNKPLHLGHLRNDVLGESISRILAACGADVKKVCIINDRGIHICKSMLAYQEHGGGGTPEAAGMKSDHYVGNWYVKFSNMEKTDAGAILRARELLRKWEAGDSETVALWKLMNDWAVRGMKQTYQRTGVSFDKYYYESETYLRGKEEVLKGLERGLFYKAEDGSVQAQLSAEELGGGVEEDTKNKVLLRGDGTSIYITQDIGTAILRHDDWPFNKLVYVVGNEQQHHFKVLFLLLKKMGYDWAKDMYHLSYGMVNLPNGKMKSREGTVVDADNLIDELRDDSLSEIKSKDREDIVGDAAAVAEKIALGALHYYLLQITPERDMLFNPVESLSFNGNTGPYLQYMGARISSILHKDTGAGASSAGDAGGGEFDASLITSDSEWELIKTINAYTQALSSAADEMNPSYITAWLYELSKNFSRFYHNCPVLNAESAELVNSRLALCRATLAVLRSAFKLVCIPFLESM
jgi:arginyl-tRNA synthetase